MCCGGGSHRVLQRVPVRLQGLRVVRFGHKIGLDLVPQSGVDGAELVRVREGKGGGGGVGFGDQGSGSVTRVRV